MVPISSSRRLSSDRKYANQSESCAAWSGPRKGSHRLHYNEWTKRPFTARFKVNTGRQAFLFSGRENRCWERLTHPIMVTFLHRGNKTTHVCFASQHCIKSPLWSMVSVRRCVGRGKNISRIIGDEGSENRRDTGQTVIFGFMTCRSVSLCKILEALPEFPELRRR